ncbi:MAG: iron-containing alcohol dehydrogenase [Acidobacteriota bacterium]|nr:iron-containing alcohol dehydrogenase [Acidobacteriota bacterium]
MRPITLQQPRHLVFGSGAIAEATSWLRQQGYARVHLVTSPSQRQLAANLAASLSPSAVTLDASLHGEPTLADLARALDHARAAAPDAIVGLGGGSPLDTAKLVAALLRNQQQIQDILGIGLLARRDVPLVCIPTTAGTGSEVSPNAVLMDEAVHLKKAVISPHLVPDAAFIDPILTHSVPPNITAVTGLDALTHCIEAYTNRHAHPLVDVYALPGIRLIATSLLRAVQQPEHTEARECVALGSLYGGLCLGPVNTAAVHALAYPLAGEFHMAHGLSNALLLPAVFAFNAQATPERHAAVSLAMGLPAAANALQTALAGAQHLQRLAERCGIVMDLAAHDVPRTAIPRMAATALTVTRLLRNNPRSISQPEAEAIYTACFR